MNSQNWVFQLWEKYFRQLLGMWLRRSCYNASLYGILYPTIFKSSVEGSILWKLYDWLGDYFLGYPKIVSLFYWGFRLPCHGVADRRSGKRPPKLPWLRKRNNCRFKGFVWTILLCYGLETLIFNFLYTPCNIPILFRH